MIGILATAASIFLRGWALSVLWGWFVVPFGVAAIGPAHAYGLVLISEMFRSWPVEQAAMQKCNEASVWMLSLGVPLAVVGMGWTIKEWLM